MNNQDRLILMMITVMWSELQIWVWSEDKTLDWDWWWEALPTATESASGGMSGSAQELKQLPSKSRSTVISLLLLFWELLQNHLKSVDKYFYSLKKGRCLQTIPLHQPRSLCYLQLFLLCFQLLLHVQVPKQDSRLASPMAASVPRHSQTPEAQCTLCHFYFRSASHERASPSKPRNCLCPLSKTSCAPLFIRSFQSVDSLACMIKFFSFATTWTQKTFCSWLPRQMKYMKEIL